MGFGGERARRRLSKRIEEEILAELRRTFSPEFINRIDEVIVFNPLGEEELRAIVDILLDEINETLAQRDLRVEVTPEARGGCSSTPVSSRRPGRVRCAERSSAWSRTPSRRS